MTPGQQLALAAVAALAAAGAAKKRGSRSVVEYVTWSDIDEVSDMEANDAITEEISDGLGIGERRIPSDTRLKVTAARVSDLFAELRKSYPGDDDDLGRPVDIWSQDHWDYRGPPHVNEFASFMKLLVPPEFRSNPSAIMKAFLKSGREPVWGEHEAGTFRVWEDEDRDKYKMIGTKPRNTSSQISIPPVIFSRGGFVDGRHRLFAANMAGLEFIPMIDTGDLQ